MTGEMIPTEALTRVRQSMGPRATVRREDGEFVVGRNEIGQSGYRFFREYGRGTTCELAIERAFQAYRTMCSHE